MTPFMSTKQLDIASADKADMIKYYTLPDGKYGIIIFTGGKNYLNLCEYDDCWQQMKNKADELFLEFPQACADELTREILEKRKNFNSEKYLEKFLGNKMYGEKYINFSLALFSDKFTEYILSEIFDILGTEYSFRGIKRYRNKFTVKYIIDGTEKEISGEFFSDKTEFKYIFGNLSAPPHRAEIKLNYNTDSIYVTSEIFTKRNIFSEYRFDIANKKFIRKIYENGNIIFSEDMEMNLSEEEISQEIAEICGTENLSAQKIALPWEENIFISESNDTEMFIAVTDKRIIQIFHGKTDKNGSEDVRLIHEIFDHGEIPIIQSEFYRGRYGNCNGKRSGGYFYRCFENGELHNIDPPIL